MAEIAGILDKVKTIGWTGDLKIIVGGETYYKIRWKGMHPKKRKACKKSLKENVGLHVNIDYEEKTLSPVDSFTETFLSGIIRFIPKPYNSVNSITVNGQKYE